jgi:site-specific recombinase XerC
MQHVTKDWKRELQDIIAQHNDRHAVKNKSVSYKTMRERSSFYVSFFTELRSNEERCYKITPSRIAGRHIQFMVNRWVERELAPNTIHDYLSKLRVFAEWLGKDGLVRDATFYVSNPALVNRTYSPENDKSWSAHGVDCNALIAQITEADLFVGAQLAMCLAFGLRVNEAIMFQPFIGVSADGSILTLVRGTKGGRKRDVPIDTEEKRHALQLARTVAIADDRHLGRPELSLEQNRKRFYKVVAKFGVTRADLHTTANGLRHQYGNDRYEQFAHARSPVRAGPPIDRNMDRTARLATALELGHSRGNITTTYVGAVLNIGRPDAPLAGSVITSSAPLDDTQSIKGES